MTYTACTTHKRLCSQAEWKKLTIDQRMQIYSNIFYEWIEKNQTEDEDDDDYKEKNECHVSVCLMEKAYNWLLIAIIYRCFFPLVLLKFPWKSAV